LAAAVDDDSSDDDVLIPPPDVELPQLRPPARERLGRQAASWSLLVAGLASTTVLAVIGTQGQAIAALPIIALTVISGIFQVASVVAGNSANKVDPNLVKTVVRRLTAAQLRVITATRAAEQGRQQSTNHRDRLALGTLSVELSHVQDHLGDSIQTWRDLRPELFEEGGTNGGNG